jgi:hypothetical protein
MDSAKDKYTGQVVDGEQLWLINVVDKDGYVCRGCGVLVNPVSFEKGLKTRPHFREYPKYPHEIWCNIEGEEELIKTAKKKSIKNENGFPCSFPHKLELIDSRKKVSNEGGSEEATNSRFASSGKEGASGSSSSVSKWVARTIRPICRTYNNFPKDRDLPLSITGLFGDIYNDIIRKLSSQEIVKYTKNHLLYAPISWKRPTTDGENFIFELSYGYWTKNGLTPYKVVIDSSDWSQAKVSYILEELEVARNEAIQAKKKDKKARTKSWLFFIGEQSVDSPDTFTVNDHRLICCLTLDSI